MFILLDASLKAAADNIFAVIRKFLSPLLLAARFLFVFISLSMY
jgi:hypothetical protein